MLRYQLNTNTFGAHTKESVPKTFFRPKDGIEYWEGQ